MLEDNICAFAKKDDAMNATDVSILNMVYETDIEHFYNSFKIKSCYVFNIVVSGKGKFHTLYKTYDLKENDFFITYPSTSYRIESTDNLKIVYISFIGNLLVEKGDRFLFNKNNPHIHLENHDLKNLYFKSINNINKHNINYLALGAFYYTLSTFSKGKKEENKSESSITIFIKNYVGENYSDPNLKLNSLAKKLNYHANYISTIFRKEFNETFSAYLQSVRLSSAIHLINNGFSSVKEIATLCGFNDALYFSKSFKKAYGCSPTTLIKNKNNLYKLK